MNMLNEFEKYCFQFRKDKIFKKVLKNLKERGGKIFLTTFKIFSNNTESYYYRVVVAEAVRAGHILAPAHRAAVVQEAASAVSGLDTNQLH